MKFGKKFPTLVVCAITLVAVCIAGISLWAYKKKVIKNSPEMMQNTQSMTGMVTNQWYSSLYFTKYSENMFAFPLAYHLGADGLAISYPQLKNTPKTIFGSFTTDILVSLPKASTELKKEMLSADAASVAFRLCSEQDCVSTRIAHGSPLTFITAESPLTLTVAAPARTSAEKFEEGEQLNFLHGTYVVGVFHNDSYMNLSLDPSKTTWDIPLAKGDKLVIALQPIEKNLHFSDLEAEITSTQFNYTNNSTNLETTLSYSTNGKADALIALLPHQWQNLYLSPIGTYQSVRGLMKLYRLPSIPQKLSKPKVLSINEMVTTLSAPEKQQLLALIDQEMKRVNSEQPIPQVYDAGKQVFRIAQLYQIAHELHSPQENVLRDKVVALLRPWIGTLPSDQNSLLKYSDTPKGVIAKNAQFGNELFNDHHFHYGYFLAAAGILLQNDPGFTGQFEPGINALLQDVGNTDVKNGFPYLRGFDPYESHSWADGRALASDGNNQESTSEAVNRWYGIYLVGKVLKNDDMLNLGLVGMSMEQQAAQIYWLGQRPDLFQFSGDYTHPMASLVWGGKVDFATWFSDKPTHIYGIQFLPMTPAMTHITNTTTWAKYHEYGLTNDPTGWNDIYSMVAAANGQDVPDQLPQYEAGNSAPFYYLWVHFWKDHKTN